jgi:hypothetical protein
MRLQRVITIILLAIAIPVLLYLMAKYYDWPITILLAAWIAVVNHNVIKGTWKRL